MELKIRYLGLLAEVTKCEEEHIFFSGTSISELLETLYTRYSGLKEKDFQVAQNMELVSFEEKVTSTNVVLLPPFSGG